ncbi:ankyrin repeat domain-containing protein [Pseudomonadota bacterium]
MSTRSSVSRGKVDIARLLLEHQANIHDKDKLLGRSALHIAIVNIDPDMIELLLKWKVNVFAKDGNGQTPIQYAQERMYLKTQEWDAHDEKDENRDKKEQIKILVETASRPKPSPSFLSRFCGCGCWC